jgi:endonuclease-3
MNKIKRQDIFERFKQSNPNPTTELIYKSHFELLISVILSAQATDVSVNKATHYLYAIANTPESILKLGMDGLKHYIKTIGLFNTKAKHIIKTCEKLVLEHQSKVPNQRLLLEALPGVGRKTANVVLNTAFGYHTIAVDTHIFRVANRTHIAKGKNVIQVEEKLLKCIPKAYLKDAHHWLILHGRYTCMARKPRCTSCLIHDLCEYSSKIKE